MDGMRRGTRTELRRPPARLCREEQPNVRAANTNMLTARVLLALLTLLPGCSGIGDLSNNLLGSSGPPLGTPGYVSGFLGGGVADKTRAAPPGRANLSGCVR